MRRPALRRPVVGVYWPPARRLQLTRGRRYYLRSSVQPQITIATQPRRRTRFHLGAALLYLARRRYLAALCRHLGWPRVGRGAWRNPEADAVYAMMVVDDHGFDQHWRAL